jgi:WD40 repeat protein
MVDTKTSLTDRLVAYETGDPVQSVAFLDGIPAVVSDSGGVLLGAPGSARRVVAHPDGAVLASATDGKALITGGDDGLIVRTSADGASATMHDAKGRWIDALAAREDGAIAWSTGKSVFARDAKGTVRSLGVPTTARGLAFAPKGYRLAIAHYNGVSVWFPNTEQAPDVFEWKGSHTDVTFSPDGRFVVSAMQENALHGWRVSDRANMRMSGYPSKVKSLAWSADGFWLATSGADSCVVWPFREKDGPMNKAPRECAVRKAKISKVAFHPKVLMLAVGYEDGWILLCRLADQSETLVRRPDALRDAISALAWSRDGRSLLFGTAGGEAGLVTLSAT